MKIKLFLLTLLFCSKAIAQDIDTLKYRNGLVLDYNGYFINYFGFKYRVSHNWSPYVKVGWSVHSNSSSASNIIPTTSDYSFNLQVGTEYKVFRWGDIVFLTFGSAGFGSNNSSYSKQIHPSGINQIEYSMRLGIGAEYFVTKQFSISGSNEIVFSYKDLQYSNPEFSGIDKSMELGVAVASLQFYF